MAVSEEYTLWTRVVMGLALLLGVLVVLSIWSTIEYIKEENDNGDKNLARDVGLYTMIVVGGILTIGMLGCACTVNQPQFLQIFAGLAFVFAVVFLSVSATQADEGADSATHKQFIAFGFLIGLTFAASCLAAFRLSKINDFDPTATSGRKESHMLEDKQGAPVSHSITV